MLEVKVVIEEDGNAKIIGSFDGHPVEPKDMLDALELACEALKNLLARTEPEGRNG